MFVRASQVCKPYGMSGVLHGQATRTVHVAWHTLSSSDTVMIMHACVFRAGQAHMRALIGRHASKLLCASRQQGLRYTSVWAHRLHTQHGHITKRFGRPQKAHRKST